MVDIGSDGLFFVCVILVIFGLVCTQIHVMIHSTIKKCINIIIIDKKINLNYHFTVPGLMEMEVRVPKLG